MAHEDYVPFVDRMIRQYEGGYGWDAADRGGPTKYGITCYDLAEHRGKKMLSKTQWAPIVKAMQLSEAEDIYADKYARAVDFDHLNPGCDCVLFDYGVNSGTGRAVAVARKLLGVGSGTRMGPELVSAINRVDPVWFINAVCDERLHFLQGLRNWNTFKGGWTRRVADLRRYCIQVAKGGVKLPPVPPVPRTPKGKHHPAPVGPKGPIVVGGGAAGSHVFTHSALLTALFITLAIGAFVVIYFWRKGKAEVANTTIVIPPTVGPPPNVKPA